jgi:hypothetical protein
MDAREFERQLRQLLGLRFTQPTDPGLAERRKRLAALFEALDDPVVATIYLSRLTAGHDELAQAFVQRLATATREELLQILRRTSQGPGPSAAASRPRSPRFRLIDEDHGTERWITQDDEEFRANYIDLNIASVTSDPDPGSFTHHTMVVVYDSGRTLELPLARVPVRRRYVDADGGGYRFARVRFAITPDAYLLRKGLIFPVDHHRDVMFNDTFTPTLIDIRTAIEFNIRQRQTMLEMAEITSAFAGAVAMLGGYHASYSKGLGWVARPRSGKGKPAKAEVSLGPRRSHDDGSQPPTQRRKVTLADHLAWQRAGGHALERHSPQLTREILKSRVLGIDRFVPAPQPAKGGTIPPDLRVWRGEKSAAASKWATDATMNKAIGDTINTHLVEIRRSTVGGRELVVHQRLGYTTGEGWVTTAGPKQGVSPREQAAFYDDNLTGVTIVFRPRKGHVPTPADPEVWYVHTAYPDRAR